MTNITALDELIKAVEAGKDNSELWRPAINEHCFIAARAFHGSLDAAKALHDALLPGWEWWINSKWYWDGNEGPLATVRNGRPMIDLQVCHGKADNPARAWLLAVLRAYRAQIGGAA